MVLRTLLNHYRRHPMQGLFLLAGIVMANVLLVGTQLINAQARASYSQGERILGAGPMGRIVAARGRDGVSERLFVDLRRRGFNNIAPLLRVVERTATGSVLELYGVDALSMPSMPAMPAMPAMPPMPRSASSAGGGAAPRADAGIGDSGFGSFAFPPYRVLAAPARLRQLGARPGERLLLAGGEQLPMLQEVHSSELGHRLLMDLGALQSLTGNAGRLSALLVFEHDNRKLAALLQTLPESVSYRAEADAPDPAQLTASLHLNLAAMGLLACVVGLFLTYNAIAFSHTDRRELMRRLRLAGVARRELAAALAAELLLFLSVGGAVGLWLGALLAARLLPGVGQTLAQLYGVYIAYPDALLPRGYLAPLAMTATAGLLCALFPLRESLRAPLLERRAEGWRQQAVRRRDRSLLVAGVLLLLAAMLLAWQARDTWVALGGMACLLLGSALCLPAVLRWLLDRLAALTPPSAARAGWLLADSRWLLGPASLALMAMMLALVANSGLNTMIGSFRGATDNWLQQRLAAQLYLRADERSFGRDLADLRSWLADTEPAAALTLRYRSAVQVRNPRRGTTRVEVTDLAPTEPFRSAVLLLAALPDAGPRLHAGEGVYISERAWRLDGWKPGDTVSVCAAQDPLPVLGVYYDYGNPLSQWLVAPPLFRACWPDAAPVGAAIHGTRETDWDSLRSRVVDHFRLDDDAVVDQRQLRRIGLAVFDRTFAVTRALNLLTLLVAGIGIFCAISAIHHHRVGQQALLASLGLSRVERGALLLLQWGLLGLLCTSVVLPFGTALAWYLAAVVTPTAFGWSFPLRVVLAPYATLALLASTALVLAVALPSLRLLRVSPATLLREQSS